MYTTEQFEQLEQEERELTEEAIIAMLLALGVTKSNIEKELRTFYQKYGKDGVVTYAEARKWVSDKDHRRRLTALLGVWNLEFATLHSELAEHFESFLREVIKKESSFFKVELDIDDLISTVWGVDDDTWYSRLTDDVRLWNAYLGNDLKQSLLRRDNIEDVLEQLDKRFMSMESIINKLGITESTAVGSLARQQAFKELGITKYQYYAREDERTCEQCGSLHGLVFPISAFQVGVTASPIHPHCRCWEVPIRD